MDANPTPISTTLPTCSQCGGELHPDEGQIFLTCPYCSAAVYLDKSQVVFHWYLAPTLNPEQAHGALMRWMAGNDTVKDLDQKSRVVGQTFQYFPMWYFRRKVGGEEIQRLEPAAATAVTEIRSLRLPAGDLRKYDSSVDAQAAAPTVPLETALAWEAGRGGKAALPAGESGQAIETALVHIPVYRFKYTYQNQTYTALVEAATGATLANIFPAKAEAPYLLAGGVTAAVFLCLATLPLLGAAVLDEGGLGIGALVALALALIAAPALFALAAWVASRV